MDNNEIVPCVGTSILIWLLTILMCILYYHSRVDDCEREITTLQNRILLMQYGHYDPQNGDFVFKIKKKEK